ncbi:hypothetical protein M0R88_03485 [Halorussus gelatinilyticus]|uniref:DUF7096 domain-containing protein n=1 Tax=Halorussus gelatinilyticus TaxID=2937524 RepID=A0A8U0ILG0_9EURY|nr:hypothetical protein [Halorussus gelatinilyticus]UPW01172.1 hypothetical protein M0R88_03485 [Halorussus gelatinilyticus]
MSLYRVALVALFVVSGALVVAVPAGATASGPEATTAGAAAPTPGVGLADARPAVPAAAAPNNTTANSSLGTDISSFMQSSAAEVGGAVETGMWTAAFNGTENQSVRVELVETRTSQLRKELADLRQRRAELVAQRKAGNISRTAYKAKMSRLVGEIDALRSAIDTTTNRAEQVNANVEALGNLRSETKNLTGPEIAAVARNVTGVGVGEGERGPPNGVGEGNGNGVSKGNGSGVGEGNGNGNGNAANAAGEGANGTMPGNAGNGNGVAGEGNRSGVGNGEGLADAGNESGVGNGPVGNVTGNGTGIGVGNGTDPGNATNGTRGPPSDAGSATLTTPDLIDGVSTALVAGVGRFAGGDFFAAR